MSTTTGLRAQMIEAAKRRNAERSELQQLQNENRRLAWTVQEQERIIATQKQNLSGPAPENELTTQIWAASESFIHKPESIGSRPALSFNNRSGTAGSELPPASESGKQQSSGPGISEIEPAASASAPKNTLDELLSTESEPNSLLTRLLEDTRMALHYLACTRTISQATSAGKSGNARGGNTVNKQKLSLAEESHCEIQPENIAAELTPFTGTSGAKQAIYSEKQASVETPLAPSTRAISRESDRAEIEELLEEMMQLTEVLLIERAEQDEFIGSLQEAHEELLREIEERDEENHALKNLYDPLRAELEQWSERFPKKLREHSMLLFERQQGVRESESSELLTIFEAELRGVVKNLLNDLARVAAAQQ